MANTLKFIILKDLWKQHCVLANDRAKFKITITNLVFGFRSGYSSFIGETYLVNFMGVVFFLFGVLVVYLATEVKYKRYPRPEDGGLLSGSSE